VPLVLDTGPLLALLDADDPDHERCLVMFDEIAEDLVVPAPVLVELDWVYATLDLGLVDAAVIATCERLGETKVATLDRRDFSVVRPRHCDALRVLPD
jgi:predicted nucleic acid-binding protein